MIYKGTSTLNTKPFVLQPFLGINKTTKYLHCDIYLGDGQHGLHVVLLDVEPVPQPGGPGEVASVGLVQGLVLDVPHQQPALPHLRLTLVDGVQPVEQLVWPEQ